MKKKIAIKRNGSDYIFDVNEDIIKDLINDGWHDARFTEPSAKSSNDTYMVLTEKHGGDLQIRFVIGSDKYGYEYMDHRSNDPNRFCEWEIDVLFWKHTPNLCDRKPHE